MAGRASITELIYGTLAERLLSGAFAPGARIDANAIAAADGVSPTPVRNALNRLAGAGFLVAQANEGFFAPRWSEQDLRDLYDFSGALLSLAVARGAGARRRSTTSLTIAPIGGGAALETEAVFRTIMSLCANKRLEAAFDDVNVRLRFARTLETGLIAGQAGELRRLRTAFEVRAFAELDLLIGAYHRRRLRRVTAVVARLAARAGDDAVASI